MLEVREGGGWAVGESSWEDCGEDCGARAKRRRCEVFGFESVGQENKERFNGAAVLGAHSGTACRAPY
jgi:hypothetical protein